MQNHPCPLKDEKSKGTLTTRRWGSTKSRLCKNTSEDSFFSKYPEEAFLVIMHGHEVWFQNHLPCLTLGNIFFWGSTYRADVCRITFRCCRTAEDCNMSVRVGLLNRKLFFQNAHSSAVATDVECKMPLNETDIGPPKKLLQGWQGVGAGDLPEGHGSMLLSPYEHFIIKCDPSGQKSTNVLVSQM